MLFLNQLFARLSALATGGPLAIPIWIALLLFTLSFLRGPFLKILFGICRVQDEQLEKNVKQRIDMPLQFLLMSLAFLPFTFLLVQPLGSFVTVGLRAVALILLFYILIQSADLAIFSWYLARKQANVSGVVRFFALFLLWGVATLLTLEWVFGVSVVPLLATSTVLSAILGLALQDTLRNAFAGLNMSMEKSFVEGDWVMFRLDANDQWFGQIVEIGWRTTKIKTLNNNYAIIPNSNFTNHELVNFSKPNPMHARTLDIPVNSRADGVSVRETLIQSALRTEGVMADPKPDALPTQIKSDCVVYQLRFWIDHPEQREHLTGAVLERSWQELKEMGALP